MKIMLCGKGRSGKSTITALMAKEYVRQGKRVLVADCDESNYGLHQQLGLELPKDFTDYVGGKERIMMLSANGPMNMDPLFDKRMISKELLLTPSPEEEQTESEELTLEAESTNKASEVTFEGEDESEERVRRAMEEYDAAMDAAAGKSN